MSRVLVISRTDLAADPRVDRQIEMLTEGGHEVVAAGTGPPRDAALEFVDLTMFPRAAGGRGLGLARLLARRHEAVFWTHPDNRRAAERLAAVRPHLVLANDLSALPLAATLPGSPPVAFDAHEFAPAEQGENRAWRVVMAPYTRSLLRAYLPRVAAMTTVSQGIADLYEREFGVRAEVVTNAPRHAADLRPGPVGDTIRLLHHGIANRGRRLEDTLDAFARLDERFSLDLVLAEHTPGYRDELAARAAEMNRVRVLPPRPMRELVAAANAYDIGVFLLPPRSANHLWALPNKLFEFIQARLAVAVGPSPEMARVVSDWGCGTVSEDFSPASFAAALNVLSADDVMALKQRSHQAAAELCFEPNRDAMLALVDRALAGR